MDTNKKRESGFLVQGSILAIASLISRVIGLIYRIPLQAILGDIGNDYISTAMEVYSVLLLISSYSLPLAVSKLVSTRMAKGEKRNAYRIFKGAFVFALLSGMVVGLVVYFFAGPITGFLRTPMSVFALRALAPTLLVVALLGVIRGFFQGLGTMVPSAISQLLEQIVNAGVSIWMAFMLYQYGARVGAVLGNRDIHAAAYGAAGGTIGTGAGAIIALLFVAILFAIYRPNLKGVGMPRANESSETYRNVIKVLILTIVPVLLSTTVYNLTTFIDMSLFKNLAHYMEYEEQVFSTMWGMFTGKYRPIVNVPIAFASALAASSVPSLAKAFAVHDMKLVRRKIHAATRYIMIIALPCAVGLGVLGYPIMELLFHRGDNAFAGRLMQIGAISIVFFALSTLTNAILQGISRMKVPVVNALIALALHLVVLVGLQVGLNMHIYSVVIANTSFSLFMCILNGRAIHKYARYRQEVPRTFVIPSICALLMGASVFGIYRLLMMLAHSNALATIVSIVIGSLVYFVLMILLRGLTKKDLAGFPKGQMWVKIAQKMRLIK